MIIRSLDKMSVMDTPHAVDARNLYNTENAVISVIALQPGQALKPHITPVDVAFYVLEGTGTVQVGEEIADVSKDSLVESPKDIVHCWYNNSGALLRFLVIKVPKPTKKTLFNAC
jgi:quercetin dioxygenase-like cupin family protein